MKTNSHTINSNNARRHAFVSRLNPLSSWLRPLLRSNVPLAMLAGLSLLIANTSFAQVTNVGFLRNDLYLNKARTQLEAPGFAATPDNTVYLSSFETPVRANDQFGNYAESVSGWFKPPTSGNYVFFICSNDDSDLFLSTDDTPANLRLIARETRYSNQKRIYVYHTPPEGPSDPTAKRSDLFAGSEWPTPNFITLTAGQRYYIRGVHFFPSCCTDNLSATYIMEGEPDPVNGSAPTIAGNLIETIVPPGPPQFTINTIQVITNNLKLSITSPTNPTPGQTYAIQKTSTIAPTQWTNVTTATFTIITNAGSNFVVATFPLPTNSTAFYRAAIVSTNTGPNTNDYTIGITSLLDADSGNADRVWAQNTTNSQTGTIQSLSFYVNALGGDLVLGIYDATGPNGEPGNKVAGTAVFTPTVVGWNTQNVITPVSLPPGTYWLAYLPSSNDLGFLGRSGFSPSTRHYSYPFGTGALPDPFSTSTSGTSYRWSFYATLQP